MTLDDFIVAWFKKGLEVAGSPEALNQCVDLANGYIRDVLGLPIIEWTDAKDFPSKVGDKYEYIKSTPTNFPVSGDIVVWNGNIGSGHGHIAVALGGDALTYVSVDENWSISQRVTVERHNYDNVDGWLHPKILQAQVVLPSDKFGELVSKSTKYDEFVAKGYNTANDTFNLITSLQGTLQGLREAYSKLELKCGQLQEQLNNIPPIVPCPTEKENKAPAWLQKVFNFLKLSIRINDN